MNRNVKQDDIIRVDVAQTDCWRACKAHEKHGSDCWNFNQRMAALAYSNCADFLGFEQIDFWSIDWRWSPLESMVVGCRSGAWCTMTHEWGSWSLLQCVATHEGVDGDRKSWVFLILRSMTDLCDQFVEGLKSCDEKGFVWYCEEQCGSRRIKMARESFRALILCGEPKSNGNIKCREI